MSTAGALGALSSDLAFSVSFAIAHELLLFAKENGLTEDELIGTVLTLSALLSSVPRSIFSLYSTLSRRRLHAVDVRVGDRQKPAADEEEAQLSDFFMLLFDMTKRISISVCVQLLATNVRARQPVRTVRIVSLVAVSIFFLFLGFTSSVGARKKND